MKTYNFSLDSLSFLDEIENEFFRKVVIKAFASGPNAHTLPVDEDVLRRCSYTIYNKPILWKYNPYTDDAMSHEKDEVPCGFVPENEHNPILFSKETVNGEEKTFLIVNALIWTKYCGRLIEIFKRDDMHKDVSIEIAIIEDKENSTDKPKIKDFVVSGITILGEYINPAVKGCEAVLLAFAEDKDKYLNSFDEKYIAIDNSKESAVSGSWSNPRRKLFNPIVEASNTKSLLRESYLIGDFNSENPEITKFKYPHHVVRNGKLVIHKDGLQAAFQRASQQGIVQGNVKSHLLRHYRELGLSTENFSEFNISKEEFDLYFSDEFSNNESVGEIEMADNNALETGITSPTDVDFSTDGNDKKETEVVNNADDKNVSDVHCDDNNGNDNGNNDKNENDDGNDKDDKDDKGDNKEEKMSIEEAMAEIGKLTAKCGELESANAAYMAKLCDYDELKKFKEETEAKMAKEAEFAAMSKVMSEIADRGIEMSDSEKEALMGKFSEFSSIDAWTNYVKAQIFDKAENIDSVIRMGLPFENPVKKPSSIWD